MRETIIVQSLNESLDIPKRVFNSSEQAYKYAYNLSILYECDVRIKCYLDEKCWGCITIRVNKKVGEKCPVIK